jgi:hypothetical protein
MKATIVNKPIERELPDNPLDDTQDEFSSVDLGISTITREDGGQIVLKFVYPRGDDYSECEDGFVREVMTNTLGLSNGEIGYLWDFVVNQNPRIWDVKFDGVYGKCTFDWDNTIRQVKQAWRATKRARTGYLTPWQIAARMGMG